MRRRHPSILLDLTLELGSCFQIRRRGLVAARTMRHSVVRGGFLVRLLRQQAVPAVGDERGERLADDVQSQRERAPVHSFFQDLHSVVSVEEHTEAPLAGVPLHGT